MEITDFAIMKALAGGGGGGGGGITPEQLATYIKNNTIKNVSSIPSADISSVGNVIYNRTDNKIYRCENTGTTQSPVYTWVEKICLAIDELPSSDIPQTLDNDKKFYLTKESVTKDGQAVTNYQWYKLSDIAKTMGFSVNAEGIVLPDSTIKTWEEITSAGWQEVLRYNYFGISSQEDSDAITGSTYQDAEIINGNVNNAWFVTYIGNVSVSLPKLLYEDKNGVKVVGTLSDFEQILQAYQKKITAGAGLVFDGNTLKHSNSVTPKPQRYIRATAYDAQGHAINFGVDYLVSRSDYNDDAVSDLHLSSSLWVNKHYSPIVSTLNVVNPSDCLFNFPLSEDVTTGSAPKVFFTQLTNLITGGTDYGFVTTVEKKNGNGNFYFEQTFKKEQQGNADSQIAYYRKGSIVNNTDVTVLNIYENRALITWGAWFPVEYPVTVFTSDNPDFSITSMSFYVSGGMVNIFINELKQLVASPASNIIATLPSCLKCKNDIGAHGLLINSENFDSFATLSEIAINNTLKFRGGKTAGKYYGNLSYGIGY